MTTSSAAVRFDHVEKSFRVFASPLQRVREVLWPFGPARSQSVAVLKDVSFTVDRGQTVAIIGANGVGKSTLLHLVAGLLEPSSGVVQVDGRVTGLFDLGGGFLPDLTGRENARFFHRIIARSDGDEAGRERAIEQFAEIGDFFDRPVRTYSSGMFLRLAFAAAICEQPDILLIDEVLAVGDARFQQKCYRRMRDLREAGTTILIVTHVVHALAEVCDRVLVLENGRIVFDGDPARGIDRYYQLFFAAPERPDAGAADEQLRYGSGGASIIDAFSCRQDGMRANAFEAGEVAHIAIEVEFRVPVEAPQFGISCSTKEGTRVYATSSGMLGQAHRAAAAGERRKVGIDLTLDVTVPNLFVDISVFEIINGMVTVLDARVGVLHLTLSIPHHCIGVTDLSASIRDLV